MVARQGLAQQIWNEKGRGRRCILAARSAERSRRRQCLNRCREGKCLGRAGRDAAGWHGARIACICLLLWNGRPRLAPRHRAPNFRPQRGRVFPIQNLRCTNLSLSLRGLHSSVAFVAEQDLVSSWICIGSAMLPSPLSGIMLYRSMVEAHKSSLGSSVGQIFVLMRGVKCRLVGV